MHVIEARNVNDALIYGMQDMDEFAQKRTSRNGDVLVMPGPVTTKYGKPTERVLFSQARDANPFFHFYEGLWMLFGANDVNSVAHYVHRMETFSDDGVTLHGAYGHRWRNHFGFDQLTPIIMNLTKNKDDRRNVLQMWDATEDLERKGKDVPCNTQAYFSRDYQGNLDMTVCCRSNDMIWGAYGANAVHFSMLQEYMATAIGCKVGVYYQMSNNFHTYLDTYKPLRNKLGELNPVTPDLYELGYVAPYPMMSIPFRQWNQELVMWMTEGMVMGIKEPFFRKVAEPIRKAHDLYKEGDFEGAYKAIEKCMASDWRNACNDWLVRRETGAKAKAERKRRAQDDGVAYD